MIKDGLPVFFHVVAMARNRIIGKQNKLPWHFPADLKRFKNLTMGQTIIMGRKTFESIGKPLPGRENFVLTRHLSGKEEQEHLLFFDNIDHAFRSVQTEKGFVIGGADLYSQTLSRVNGIYLTKIDAEYEGDAYYPVIPNHFELQSEETIQNDPKIVVCYFQSTHC